jgi:hypothetical protein
MEEYTAACGNNMSVQLTEDRWRKSYKINILIKITGGFLI